MTDESTYEREIGGLKKSLRSFPDYNGLVITRNDEAGIKVDGKNISVVPVWKWLINSQVYILYRHQPSDKCLQTCRQLRVTW